MRYSTVLRHARITALRTTVVLILILREGYTVTVGFETLKTALVENDTNPKVRFGELSFGSHFELVLIFPTLDKLILPTDAFSI